MKRRIAKTRVVRNDWYGDGERVSYDVKARYELGGFVKGHSSEFMVTAFDTEAEAEQYAQAIVGQSGDFGLGIVTHIR